jgi:murein DD-endopeptidase MepM/ murein hydrolase activator NlpD
VFDFERGGFWYYAHHRKVVVEPGQIVKPGDKLGEVGRTGFNAKNKRSDTHLHLMFLELNEELYPQPKNYYEWLKGAATVNVSSKAEISRSKLPEVVSLKAIKPQRMPVKAYKLSINRRPSRRI